MSDEQSTQTPPPENGEQGGQQTGGETGGRSFSQADVDRIVEQRLARERGKYSDYDEVKARAAKLDEIEEAQKSDIERERAAREKAESESAARIAAANERLRQAAILSAATEAKAIKPAHLHRLIDAEAITVADDGTVEGAAEAVASFLKDNPEYVSGANTPRPNGADQGARGGGPSQLTSTEGMSPEEIVAARREGRLDDYLSRSRS
ncbi:MAG: hypothetical protein RIB67_07525 [Miltoncostaeaceae bacterium]